MARYLPGACNIGKNEIRKRYALGVIGLVTAVVIAYLLSVLQLPRWSLAICFIPFLVGSEGTYQGYLRFCAGFAARRMFDLSGSGGKRGEITDDGAHTLDMKKAMKIHLISVVTAGVLTVLIYLG